MRNHDEHSGVYEANVITAKTNADKQYLLLIIEA